MTFSCELDPALKHFSGSAPLFPLPNVVLFPHALLPLQIFEPRYRQMTADALDGERLIAMSLMRPGGERHPDTTSPAIHSMVGLGKIIAHEKLDDGRYYLVLRGLSRARVLGEQSPTHPYRVGDLELCSDVLDEAPSYDRQSRVQELIVKFGRLFPGVNLQKLFLQAATELPLAMVCDVLLGAIPLAPQVSQTFLNELNVDRRGQMLLELLDQLSQPDSKSANRTYPPRFSVN
ncbi:LON peptidase substrate-binding domain-containing protein [Schlesneria paludicola]|uniref:LON peptidase substrate-binding domain-containing protein n=1 Tax=Schlesneria paludicola TaxID=360056 RepID=UPI00029AA2F1|nr:LON peptidase substrate-binding domain-containing protein [Schlesneria paludicola]